MEAVPSLVPNLKECAILLDVDGTIVDLAPTPREVRVSAQLRDDLSRLAQRTGGAVALVSGRPISELDLIFAPLVLSAVGGHGAEFRLVDDGGHRQAPQLDPALKRELATVAAIGPGIIVEDKGYSLALHYRLAPDSAALVEEAVTRICNSYRAQRIERLHGKFVVEIKHTGFNKATGVKELMAHGPFLGRRPIFIGDDTTDEPVFALMPELRGLAFSVGRKVGGTTGWFACPRDVRIWLQRISQEQEACS